MLTNGYWTYCGDRFVTYICVKPLRCIPETNSILYANYSSIKKDLIKEKIKVKNFRFSFVALLEEKSAFNETVAGCFYQSTTQSKLLLQRVTKLLNAHALENIFYLKHWVNYSVALSPPLV